jgi:arylsulfatase
VRDRKPTFVYNYLSEERYTITGDPLPIGKAEDQGRLRLSGCRRAAVGRGAAVTLLVNGAKVAAGQLPRTIPNLISLNEGLDVGEDVGSAVDFSYKLPFKFTGEIDSVTFELQ